jgi:hypothetical protein
MLQPRYSKPSVFTSNSPAHSLPTGKGFGGSNLNLNIDWELVFSSIDTQIPVVVCPQPVPVQQSSPLVVEVLKIISLALWLWCLVGANFCANFIGSISNFAPQAAGTDRC